MGATEKQIKNGKAILLHFEAGSNLKNSFFSSELIGIKTHDNHLLELADLIGCKVGSLCYKSGSSSLGPRTSDGKDQMKVGYLEGVLFILWRKDRPIKAPLSNLPSI